MAVFGIVVAAISVLTSLVISFCALGIYLKSAGAKNLFLLHAPMALPVSRETDRVALTTPLTTPVGRNGIDAADRPGVMEAVSKRIEMSPQQSRQFDALLAVEGLRIFGAVDARKVSPETVPDAITRLGPLPAIGGDADEPFFFETASGRVEVFSTRALFYPHRSVTPVRATAGRRLNASGHPVLTPGDVDAVAGLVEQSATGPFERAAKLNDAQMGSLRALLSDPNQQLIAASDGLEGSFIGIQGAAVLPDGFAKVDFGGGPLLMSPVGKVVLRSERDAIPAISMGATVLVIIASILSVALAIYLLIASVRLLKRPRQRLRSMRIYAGLKVIFAAISALAIGWFTHSFFTQSGPTASHMNDELAWSMCSGIGIFGVGLIFPLSVLIVSRRRIVREYFEN